MNVRAFVVLALATASCSGGGQDITGPSPGNTQTVNAGFTVNLEPGWGGDEIPAGEVTVTINTITSYGSTLRVGQEVSWNWNVYSTLPRIVITSRKFQGQPEPWDGNREAYSWLGVSESILNIAGALGFSQPGLLNRTMFTDTFRIQAAERIPWIRMYVEALPDNNSYSRRARVVQVIDLPVNWTFTE